MRGFAQHPALDGQLVIRHLELRHEDGAGLLRVVPCDGPRVHGLSSTLYIGDELWAWPDAALLDAMTTGLIKRRDLYAKRGQVLSFIRRPKESTAAGCSRSELPRDLVGLDQPV